MTKLSATKEGFRHFFILLTLSSQYTVRAVQISGQTLYFWLAPPIMDVRDDGNDAGSETTATSVFTAHTPASGLTVSDTFRYRPLSSGNKFLILERASNKAISITDDGGLRLQDMLAARSADSQWLCVEKNGYFGLLNSRSGKYIGHDGKYGMQASATKFSAWE
jgi:hypothetical protein